MQSLNQQQREAVETGDGPVLIVAGPGTGKTKTLTSRIAYLCSQGVDAGRILALTFTVKSAHEMQERVGAILEGLAPPAISTFHALGYQILKAAQPATELVFVSEVDRLAIIRDLPRSQDLRSLSTRELALLISRQKGYVEDAEAPQSFASLLKYYQAALADKGLIDFDDLLYRAYHYLLHHAEVRQRWRDTYDYILIDEFQDTNELQWGLICLLRGTDNLFVIGDPKQSIYGFRGATTKIFERFRQDFPSAREITLQINYRSDIQIVALASAIFPERHVLVPHSINPGEVQAIQTLNEYSEAELVVAQIEQGIGGSDLLKATIESKGRTLRDFAILYRTHQVVKTVQRKLHDSGIPYQVVGEGSPYEQPEVQTVIGVLRWLAGGEAPNVKGFSTLQVQAILEGIEKDLPPSQLAQSVAEALQLASDTSRRQRLAQFVGTLVRFDTRADGLQACLEHIDYIAQGDFYDPEADAVTLLTIHASKGLEFPHVILIAAEEGSLPHVRKATPTDFDEERRLFYVAITRAMRQLDIMYAQKRAGERREPSRFVTQIPDTILRRAIDPHMDRLQRKQKRREHKARQATLF